MKSHKTPKKVSKETSSKDKRIIVYLAAPVVPNEGEKAAPKEEGDIKKEEIVIPPENSGSGLRKIFSVMCFVGTVLFVALMCYYRIQVKIFEGEVCVNLLLDGEI